jgi:dipeptidase
VSRNCLFFIIFAKILNTMKKLFTTLFVLGFGFLTPLLAQTENQDQETGNMECTSITVGSKASADGSVYTSHTDDSHRTRTNILVIPAQDHPAGAVVKLYKRQTAKEVYGKMSHYENIELGSIPQVAHTYKYFSTAYPCMNEKQVAIGESTFSPRPELQSDSGMIDCQRLCQLMLERASSAREAIKIAGELLKKYGWIDGGEALTIADKKEVWHLEIVGPGKGKMGAVWVAQRVPDDHVAVNANASTIREIDLKNKDFFMASDNIYTVAEENGWWNKSKGTFSFAYVYAPESRTMLACRRREWRVFDLVAPSLKLDPNSENYPFSVKPDTLITTQKMMSMFRDYYEGTEYDMRKTLTVTDKDGKTIISPLANPFMKSDELKLHKINGGWHWRGERAIAVHFTVYGTILQCRSFLPDEVGSVCWFALDNVASSIYVPFYASITDLPETYKTDGRATGFSNKAAWWAFNRLGTIAAQRWGDMKPVIDQAWIPMETEFLTNQKSVENQTLQLLNEGKREDAIQFLTKYSIDCGNRAVSKAWETGDLIWTTFDGRW